MIEELRFRFSFRFQKKIMSFFSLCVFAHSMQVHAELKKRVRLVTLDWYTKANLITDRHKLSSNILKTKTANPEYLDLKNRYRFPSGTYLLATQIAKGIGQPAYYYFSLRDTAYMYSWNRYWPASCIKLMAAVGALMFLRDYELSGNATIELRDDDGYYHGPVWRLQRRAIRRSTNIDYNRLMEIVGLDHLNQNYLSKSYGLPYMVLQRRYTHPTPTSNLRHSPEISYQEGKKKGIIPKRHSTRYFTRCPNEANCITLFEMQDILRRVMLHFELPKEARFNLYDHDVKRLQSDLLAAKNKVGNNALLAAFGELPNVYNKAGRVPGDDHLDNLFITKLKTKKRYMLTYSVPYSAPDEKDEVTKKDLEILGELSLKALAKSRSRYPFLQHDTGSLPSIKIRVLKHNKLELRINSKDASHADIWLGAKRLKYQAKLPLTIEFKMPPRGQHPLILIGKKKWKAVSYHYRGLVVH